MAPIIQPLLDHPPGLAPFIRRAVSVYQATSSSDEQPQQHQQQQQEILPLSNDIPTPTIQPRTLASLLRRQGVTTVTAAPNPIIPATYSGLNTGPSPAEVVGIVFGSVAGVLILLWLIFTCLSLGGLPARSSVVEEEVVVRPRRHSRTVSSRSEVIEVDRSRSRSKSRSRSRTPSRRGSRRETTIIEERRRTRTQPQDDIVEVIEEHSPVRQTRRSSGRQSGFRTVDPDAFGGGNRPMRKISRR